MREVRVSVLDGYQHRQSVMLGICLIIVALLSATFNLVGFVVTLDMMPLGSTIFLSHGLWGGLLVRKAHYVFLLILEVVTEDDINN